MTIRSTPNSEALKWKFMKKGQTVLPMNRVSKKVTQLKGKSIKSQRSCAIDGDLLATYLGSALKTMRVKRSILQGELAAKLSKDTGESVTQSYISRVENSDTGVSWERLGLFCKHLDCRPSTVVRMAEFLASQRAEADRDVYKKVKAAATRSIAKRKQAPACR